MTLHALTVPKWGLAMEEGTLTAWLVKEGAVVAAGQEVADLESTKIASVLEAPASGILRRFVVREGEVRPVGALLGVISDEDDEASSIDAFVADFEARFVLEEATGAAGPSPLTIEIDGRAVRYQALGEAGADGKHAVVFIHGFGGDHRNWMLAQPDLARARATFALDLPGHGGSSKAVGDGDFAALARQVLGFLDAMDIQQAHLVGHSMGAGVALTLAKVAPHRILSVTGICGAGFGGALNHAYIDGFIAAQRRKEMKETVESLFADPAMVTREMVDDLVAYKRLDGVPEALRKIADSALGDASLAVLAATAVEAPCLSIVGSRDRVLPVPLGAETRGEVELIAGSGHMPHLDAAERVNGRIASFVDSHDRRPG